MGDHTVIRSKLNGLIPNSYTTRMCPQQPDKEIAAPLSNLLSSIFRFSIAAPQVRRYFVQLMGQSEPVQINGQGNGQGA